MKEKTEKIKQTISKKDTGNILKRIFFVCVSVAYVGVGGCRCLCGCLVVGVGVVCWRAGRVCVWVWVRLLFSKFYFFLLSKVFKIKKFNSKLPTTPGGVFLVFGSKFLVLSF